MLIRKMYRRNIILSPLIKTDLKYTTPIVNYKRSIMNVKKEQSIRFNVEFNKIVQIDIEDIKDDNVVMNITLIELLEKQSINEKYVV